MKIKHFIIPVAFFLLIVAYMVYYSSMIDAQFDKMYKEQQKHLREK